MRGAFIESLESRTLLSAAIAGELGGTLPQTLLPLSTDHVSLQISNTGDAKAKGAVGVNVYLSPTDMIGDDSVLVGTAFNHVNIKVAGSTQIALKFALPKGLADGQYFLAARVSATGVVTSSGSAVEDVFDTSPVTVSEPIASLVGSFASSPIVVGLDTVGDTSTRTVTVRATNPTSAIVHGSLTAALYLSKNSQFDSTAERVGTIIGSHLTIKPGKSAILTGQITIPASTRLGSYHLLAVLTTSQGTIFASQQIRIVQGSPPPDDQNFGDAGTVDTGSDDGSGSDTDTSAPPTTAPTTQDSGATTNPSPTTDPTDSGDGSSGDSGDDSSASGSDDSGGDDSGDDSGGDDDGDFAIRAVRQQPAAGPTHAEKDIPAIVRK